MVSTSQSLPQERDATNDQVLKDAVAAGARIGSIFKESLPRSAKQLVSGDGKGASKSSKNA